ncbi:apelin receptor 2 [Neosynchiropus ocellatus]
MEGSAPLPSPSSLPHCDYSDWSPSLAIIPAVYLLAFVVGCLGNSLVLWVYLDRGERKRAPPTESNSRKFCLTRRDSFPRSGRSSTGAPCKPSSSSSSCLPASPRPTRSLTDSLIASLALADLCFLVTLPLWAVYTALGYHWPFRQPLCQISSFLTALNMYASVFSLSMLSVERYWVLTGRRYSGPPASQSRPSRAFWILGGVWFLAGVLALPGLLLRSVQEVALDSDYDWQEDQEDTPGSGFLSCQMDYSMLISADLDEWDREWAELWWGAALSIKSTLIGFLVPLVVLLACYCSLARLLSKHFGRGPRPDRRRQRRLLRVIVTLVMAFFLCWLPLHVNKTAAMLLELQLLPYSCSLDRLLLAAQPYVTCLAYLNSCLNPLLYAACDATFRKRCRGVLRHLLRRRSCGSEEREEEPREAGEEERSVRVRTGEEMAERTEERTETITAD